MPPGSPLALVKVSALIQSEAAKGEQPFYAVTNLRIDDAAAGPATQEAQARWCGNERATRQIRVEERDASGGATAPARESDEPFNATPDIVLRVQQRLFDFGLRTENLDGNLNQETVRNLVQFQKFANLNADGRLTRSTIDKLMTTPAPSPWVTIAFDGSGNFAAETGRTRRDTELAAIERMQRRSSRDVKISSVAAPSCLGFAMTRYTERGRRQRTNFTQAFTSAGDSADVGRAQCIRTIASARRAAASVRSATRCARTAAAAIARPTRATGAATGTTSRRTFAGMIAIRRR